MTPVTGPSRAAKGKKPMKLSQSGGGTRSPNFSFPSGSASRRNRQQVIEEDEYITDVNGSTAFATYQFAVNPGQSASFPWLSTVASKFEKYRFEYLEFYYKPQVSPYATNGQAGKVILSLDFDASDNPPTTKTQVESTHPHEDGMPFEVVSLVVDPTECTREDAWFVRPGSVPGGADIKTYDVGVLSVSTYNNAATTNVGELRVKYHVRLWIPVQETTVQVPRASSLFTQHAAQSAVASGSTFVFDTLLFDALGVGAPTAGVFTPALGVYRLHAAMSVSTSGNDTIEVALYKNGAIYDAVASRPQQCYACCGSGNPSGTTIAMNCIIACNGTDTFNFVVTLNGGTLTTFADCSQLLVCAA